MRQLTQIHSSVCELYGGSSQRVARELMRDRRTLQLWSFMLAIVISVLGLKLAVLRRLIHVCTLSAVGRYLRFEGVTIRVQCALG